MANNILDKTISSVWIDGPNKSKSVPDTFGKDVDKILGEFKVKEITNLDTLFKQGSKAFGGKFDKFLSKFDLKNLGINKDQIKNLIDNGKRIADAAKHGMEVYQQFKEGNYSMVLDNMRGVLGDGLVDMGKYGLGVRDLVQNADFHSLAGIMSFTKELTGIDMADALGINDLQAKMGSLVSLAQKYGGADIINKLQEKLFGQQFGGGLYPGLDKALAHGLAWNATFSQVDTIDEILKIIDGRMAGEVNPDLIIRILENYRLPTNWKEDTLEQEKIRLLRIFDKVDPQWNSAVINGIRHYKTHPWQRLSEDAKTLFANDETYGLMVAISPTYPEIGLKDALNQTYPYLKLN